MRVVITGGPSSEPIDKVRVITNRSTGELAVTLAGCFGRAGHRVTLFLGHGSVFRQTGAVAFERNEDLDALLDGVEEPARIDLVLHAAALSDFGVERVSEQGVPSTASKITSAARSVELRLVPKPKLIGKLRRLFPSAFIVGWKLEFDGDRADTIAEAKKQIRENHTDACILNGPAFGAGFGFCQTEGLTHSVATRQELAEFLLQFAESLPVRRRVRSER
jgi:phosphopantothenoylcysteine decarboxylase/phosphopantothenate--cysteine ligase